MCGPKNKCWSLDHRVSFFYVVTHSIREGLSSAWLKLSLTQEHEAVGWTTAGMHTRHLEEVQVPPANCRSAKYEHNRCIPSRKLRMIASSWCQFSFCISSWNSNPPTALIEWNEDTIWAWHRSNHGNHKIIS